jgi:hypothetical protein
VVSSSVINAYRKIRPGMSSGKCSVRIKGSSGIETPDSSGKIYNGLPFRKRIYRQLTSRGPTSMRASFGFNARRQYQGRWCFGKTPMSPSSPPTAPRSR